MSAIGSTTLGGLTGTVTLREGRPDDHVFNVELGKFKELHTVPGTDFSVQGAIDHCAQIFFNVYNKHRANIGYVQLRLVVFQEGKYTWIGDIDHQYGPGYPQLSFWPDGNFIHIDVVHMQPNEEGILNQIAKIFIQTVTEFANQMHVANRIYGTFCHDDPMRFHDLGMKCLVYTKETEIQQRALRRDRSNVGSVPMYVTAKCAQSFNQLISEQPIFSS